MKKISAFLILLVFVLGCVQQQITTLTINNVEYQFSNDVRDALKIPVSDKVNIQILLLSSNNIDVIFDCSVPEELPSFSVAGHNIVSTIQNYLVYNERRFAVFNTYCFRGEQWYNATDNEIEKPQLGTTLWFKGPKTGANETSVVLDNKTIIISGTDHRNLTLATDALSLAFLGVKNV